MAEAHVKRPAESARTWTLTPWRWFARVVGLLVGDAVDRHQGAVEDRVGESGDAFTGGLEVVGQCGDQVHRFADVAPGGAAGDAGPGGQAGAGVAVAQVREHEHEERLATRVQAPPPRPTSHALRADGTAQVDEGAVGQR